MGPAQGPDNTGGSCHMQSYPLQNLKRQERAEAKGVLKATFYSCSAGFQVGARCLGK